MRRRSPTNNRKENNHEKINDIENWQGKPHCASATCYAQRNFMTPVLIDTDSMPFGRYKGTPMQDVPASYLHWLWANGKKNEKSCPVADYIIRNMVALKQEHPDGIWA